MENKINLQSHESAPTCSKSKPEVKSSSFVSSMTHPSVQTRNTDDIFKRIRSGKDILSKLPTRLDPNVEFTDDEDEEEVCEKKTHDNEEVGIREVEKTPELPSKPKKLFEVTHKAFQTRKTIDSTPLQSIPRHQIFSECRPPPIKNNMGIRSLLPQSENKAFKNAGIHSRQHHNFDTSIDCQRDAKIPFQNHVLYASSKKQNSVTNETILVNGKVYSVLSLVGSGGSCKVYSVYDCEKRCLAAVKKVNLQNADPAIRDGYKKEIEYLSKLQDSLRVIKMYDYEYRSEELYIVLEHGEIDFAKYISKEAKLERLSPLMIKFYWLQMLEAVADIHKYGIVHSDLKPANFLLVGGNLKLIDFGIATTVPDDKTSTFRETQVGTINFMSPEAITQLQLPGDKRAFKVGVKSDVWSLGCILYNLVYGFTPFHSLKNLVQKIHAIMNPMYEITFKPLSDKHLLDVLKLCLKRDPKERASVSELLNHPYLTQDKKISLSATESPTINDPLKNLMEQMQGLTPRRMGYVAKMVEELSLNKNNSS